jgi:hypothetical protein
MIHAILVKAKYRTSDSTYAIEQEGAWSQIAVNHYA